MYEHNARAVGDGGNGVPVRARPQRDSKPQRRRSAAERINAPRDFRDAADLPANVSEMRTNGSIGTHEMRDKLAERSAREGPRLKLVRISREAAGGASQRAVFKAPRRHLMKPPPPASFWSFVAKIKKKN
ncbi:hypothetical protein EVAR_92534_1 [Eumeta japonica]|uniref:Uncharacterized protein n=1 Tax=Eumeta variegata TaxID=151549 RepID=A0A4C1T5W6_EUMVA|nr:hypothetical protein EVAR_92534_1 [Eumeta japonica]